MFTVIDKYLAQLSTPLVLCIALALVVFIAVVDYAVGWEIGMSYFYLVPITIVVWNCRPSLGYVVCIISAGAWFVVDALGSYAYSHPFIPFWNGAVRLGFFVTTAYLLTSLKQRLEFERHLASIDGLTHLYNARAFRVLAQQMINLSTRYSHPLVLGYIDLDNFKQVNDQLGHSEGDAVLQMVGDTLRNCLRSSDIVGRVGGDEFVIAMPETDRPAAESAFGKIHAELLAQCQQRHWPVGFSVGVAVFVTAPATLDEAVNFADQLMYQVKRSGKNEVVLEEYPVPTNAGTTSADQRQPSKIV